MNKMPVRLNVISVGHGAMEDGKTWAKMTVLTEEKSDIDAAFGLKLAKYSVVDAETGRPSPEIAHSLQNKLSLSQKNQPLTLECEAVLVTSGGTTSLAVCGFKAS